MAHNVVRPRPDPKYVKAITASLDLETLFLNIDDGGVSVTLEKR